MFSSIPIRSNNTFDTYIKISLARPNKKVIGKLNEAFNIKQSLRLGQLNEIVFDIPYTLEKNYELVKNRHVEDIEQRYLLKVEALGNTEWYIITNISDSLNDSNIKSITAYNLAHQLSDKFIRQWAGVQIDGEYRKESLNIVQVLNSILKSTNWTLGNVDGLFLTRYRTIDFVGTTVLDAIYTTAEKFNALIVWDDKNRKINLINPEDSGKFRGLRISENNLLQSFEKDSNSDEMATHLKLYGREGLTIREVNPTGTEFLEDFSYFMRGFNVDSQGNVISSSKYMTDELCLAIVRYRNKVIQKTPTFKTLLSEKKVFDDLLTVKENELAVLETELLQIQDKIILNQTQNNTVIVDALIEQESDKKAFIRLKKIEIDEVLLGLGNKNTEIINLKNDLALERNYTSTQIEEMNNFIIEKTWENEYITTPEELLELGEKELEKLNKPSSVYNVGLLALIKENKNITKKIILGDKIRVFKKEIDETFEAQIIELEIDYDSGQIDLVIADSVKLNSDEDALTKLLYKSISSSTVVELNKNKWDDISSVGQQVENILTNAWDSAKQEIISGVNQSVIIDRTGITTRDMDNPNKFIRVVGGVIGLTEDNGRTFKTAITAKGVSAERIVGRILIGQELFMENQFGTFRFDQDGVTVNGNNFKVIGGLNGVTINPQTGITVTSQDQKVRSILNATDGIKVQVKKGSAWYDEFYYDVVNERLIVDGEIRARDIKINGQSVLTDNKEIKASAIETLEVGKNVIMGANASINWESVEGAITGQFTYLKRDKIFSPIIEGGVINGTTIKSIGSNSSVTINEGEVKIVDRSNPNVYASIMKGSMFIEEQHNQGNSRTIVAAGGFDLEYINQFNQMSTTSLHENGFTHRYIDDGVINIEISLGNGLKMKYDNVSSEISYRHNENGFILTGIVNILTPPGTSTIKVNNKTVATQEWVLQQLGRT